MSIDPNSVYGKITNDLPGGEKLLTCLQCGMCGGSCPSGEDMEYTPRKLFAMIAAGQDDDVLRSNTFWYCVSCYLCTVRCPQQIPITDIMYHLKHQAIQAGLYTTDAVGFSETFIGQVETFGRAFELGLATQFYLTHHPLDRIRMGPMALAMMSHGRINLRPKRIKNMRQLRLILDKAKEIGGRP
ncbi:MAG: 4Fe-4S dicluster domain-containing protein [Anaerolineales bacterium]|nr:4Fe-4S dicluster domain-containing protein [Anaerolineales bacterium]